MRLRIRSTKLGRVRFVSHRDGARIWERAMRAAEVPLARSEGFTPRPKLSFGLALPTGAESLAEFLDAELTVDHLERDEIDDVVARLDDALPGGFRAVAAAPVERSAGSLQESVGSVTWELWSDHLDADALAASTSLLDAAELPLERERKGKRRVDDVRPAVLDLRVDHAADRLIAELATAGRALRPAELAALAFPDVDPLDVRALRTHQWIHDDDGRREVLPLPGVDVDAPGTSPLEVGA